MADITREKAIDILDMFPYQSDNGESMIDACELAISDMEKIEKYEEAMGEILAEINTSNRGTCDYYIVDQIENIINGLRKEVL